jgi:hypothetical protein
MHIHSEKLGAPRALWGGQWAVVEVGGRMEWAPSRRADVASKGQLGELKREVGLPL